MNQERGATARSGNRRRAFLAVAATGLAHRLLLFLLYRPQLEALGNANSGWYTMQHLPVEMLRDHLLVSILALQQTPPVSNVLMGIVLKSFSWPVGVASALILLQGIVSVATALIAMHVLLELYPRRVGLAIVFGLAFAINTDLVVIEYNSLGQTFYEHLGMLFGITLVWALIALRRTGATRFAVAAGLFVALLALTRATWSYIAIPALALAVWLGGAPRWRHALAFLAPVLLLHGGWAVKNWYVYGYLSPATSTWAGWNFARGIGGAGFLREYRRFIAAHHAPEEGGLRCALVEGTEYEIDPEVRARDARIDQWLGIENASMNTLEARAQWRDCERCFFAFARHSPRTLLRKTWNSYQLFWLPPASYGFVDLFATTHRLRFGLSPLRALKLIWQGELPEDHLVASGTFPRITYAPARLFTLRWLDPILEAARQVGVHFIVPAALVIGIIRRISSRHREQPRALGFPSLVVLATLFAYVALVSCAGEHGENMRYRIAVEPIIWLLPIVAIGELAPKRATSPAPATLSRA